MTAEPRPTGLRRDRVVEIIVTLPGGRGRRGSGYLVTPYAVLTASHVVDDAEEVSVRFDADRPGERTLAATVAWRHPGVHIAVLTLAEPGAGDTDRTPLGRAGERDDDLPCSTAGFPRFQARTDERGTYRDMTGESLSCNPLAGSRSGTLALRVDRPPAWADGPASPWGAMSGAAVFCRGRLIGVVIKDEEADGPYRLTASHVGRWAERLAAEDPRGLARLEELLGHALTPAELPDVTDAAALELPEGVRTHRQELALEVNQRKYVKENRLPFLRPLQGEHPADPHQLWKRLSAPSGAGPARGIVLVGPAGVGKTRTCFEVAELAERDGWRALHVDADVPVTAADLVAATRLQPRRNVLFVLDYLENLPELDLRHFAQLLEERAPRDVQVACVASARVGALDVVRSRDPQLLFEPQPMCEDDAHQEAVTGRILEHVAGGAIDAYGRDAVTGLCGPRPGPALMRAQGLEAGAREGATLEELSRPDTHSPIRLWTRRRTDADLAGLDEIELLAAAVATVACPQDGAAVHEAVASLLDLHRGPSLGSGAEGVIGGLVGLGWLLRSSDGRLDVMLDVVADDMLRRVCLRNGVWFQADTARALLSALLVSVPTFRLGARHLRRWTADLGPDVQRQIQQACAAWLRVNGAELGERLAAETDRGTARRTLLALLTDAPWQPGAMATWDALVAPWLRVAERDSPHLVRNLLDHAVRNAAAAVPERLAAEALGWLRRDAAQTDTRDLAESLARARGLPETLREEIIAEVVGWLARNGAGPQRRWVLTALLARDDLRPELRGRVLDLGLAGIGRHADVAATAHLIYDVFKQPWLGERLGRAVHLGQAWLVRHPEEPLASFALDPLLQYAPARRPDLVDRALDWLEAQGPHPYTTFVLRRLLARDDLGTAETRRAATFALRWLREHSDAEDASYALAPLLRADGLTEAQATEAADHAMAWLNGPHGTVRHAHYVHRALLDRPRAPGEPAPALVVRGMAWLDEHATTADAGSVLPGLLALPGPDAGRVRRVALDWLTDPAHRTLPDAKFTLGALLKHALREPEVTEAGGYALDWLAEHGAEDDATFVLAPLLRQWRLPEEPAARAVTAALGWLAPRGTGAETRFVLDGLLRRSQGRLAIGRALVWLERHPTDWESSFVLAPLLARSDLAPEQADRLIRCAFRWLTPANAARPGAVHTLWPLLAQSRLDALQRRRIARLALHRAVFHHEELTSERLAHLAATRPLPPRLAATITDLVLARLEPRDGVRVAAALLTRALKRRDISAAQAGRLADFALYWLTVTEAPKRLSGMLRALLSRDDLGPERTRAAIEKGREWAATRPDTSGARVIMELIDERSAGS